MQLIDLKNKLEDGTLGEDPIVFKYSDNKFLCEQYVSSIAKSRKLSILYIDSLEELDSHEDLFEDGSYYLYVWHVDKIMSVISPEYKNLVVICKEPGVNECIEIPKLINWQVDDYIKMRLPGLSEKERQWLCTAAKYNIYRLEQECNKISSFISADQQVIFKEMNLENMFCDLNTLNIFNFTNAIIKKDICTLNDMLSNILFYDIEGIGVVTILIKNIKNIIDIQFNSKATAESLNMPPKQFAAIKYNVGKFTNEQLIKIYEFLLSIDHRLKSGDFSFSSGTRENNNQMVNYLTVKMLNLEL